MSRPEPAEFEIFNAVDAGLIVLDGDARVQAWNSWMAAASGLAAGSVRGRRLEDIFPATAETRLPRKDVPVVVYDAGEGLAAQAADRRH